MKKTITIILLLLPVISFAQYKMGTVKLGMYDPSATGSGFIIGYEGGNYIDESFNYGWSVDWFHKKYTDQKLVREFNDEFGFIHSELNELRARTNLHDIPIMFNITGRFPVAPRMDFYLTGAAGVEVMLIFYRSFQNPEDDNFKSAFDFTWRLGAGVSYQIGHRSEFLAELGYHSAEPSWTYEVEDNGRTRVFERSYDMSGIMMRVGFRFFY